MDKSTTTNPINEQTLALIGVESQNNEHGLYFGSILESINSNK